MYQSEKAVRRFVGICASLHGLREVEVKNQDVHKKVALHDQQDQPQTTHNPDVRPSKGATQLLSFIRQRRRSRIRCRVGTTKVADLEWSQQAVTPSHQTPIRYRALTSQSVTDVECFNAETMMSAAAVENAAASVRALARV
jgi:hypothetical protein